MSTSPPKLITGASLLFWGYLTGYFLPGLIAAILLEARPLLGISWNFKRESYIKAWQFSILCGAFVAIVAWINGMNAGKIHTIFIWAPFIMLPVELTQRYGNADKMPLNTFSFFARRKMQQDIEEGRVISPRMINTGYPYIAIVILATAKASQNEVHHFIGLILVVGACLYAYMKNNGLRPWAWPCAFLLVMLFSYIGQWGMFKIYHHYRGGGTIKPTYQTSTDETRTRIGRLGRLKLSPRIFWRMQVTEERIPRLLRSATYNQYSKARWSHTFNEYNHSDYDEFGYRSYSSAAGTTADDRDIRWFTRETPKLTKSAPITIIGEVDAKVEEHPLPLPHHMLAIGDLDAEAYIECNSLGTIRMANPNYNVVEYSIWLADSSTTEEPPDQEPNRSKNLDLSTPQQEKDALQRVCQQLGLYNENLNTRAKIARLKKFFFNEFEYSTHLTTPRFDRGKRHSSVGIFLETSRTGHCEYFATATALLLREANIPTRYCIGFAVNEHNRDRDEWVMRGLHAHAWCRVWIEEKNNHGEPTGHWEDVDLTPAAWQSMDLAKTDTWNHQLADWWQRLREDFLIWRTREANKTKVYIVIAAIITLLFLWISWRLWHSRQRRNYSSRNRYQPPKDSPLTPLHKLEHLVAKKIGPRPEGTPLCEWLQGMLCLDQAQQHDLEKLLTPAITLHSIIRFDPAGGSPDQCEQLNDLCSSLKKVIKKISTRGIAASSPFSH